MMPSSSWPSSSWSQVQAALADRGVRIAFKDDPPGWAPFHHRLAHAFARRLVPEYDQRFTTVLGRTIYLPKDTRRAFADVPRAWEETLRHELVHIDDWLAHPILMPVTYVGLLPLGWTARAYWELRGYTQSMVAKHQAGEALDEAYIERLVRLFSGPTYVYMLWPASLAREVLLGVRARVEDGAIRGVTGSAELWRDLLCPCLRWLVARGLGRR